MNKSHAACLFSCYSFDKEEHGMNLGTWERSLQFISNDLDLGCKFKVTEKDGEISIEVKKNK
jgi:hypothetical protein